jgi:hypothetical protein
MSDNGKQIAKGLAHLGHNGWVLTGDDYDNIIWLSDAPKPSLEEVLTAASDRDMAIAIAKAATLDKLGLTIDELRLLLD